MDAQALEFTRHHYNKHANHVSSAQAVRARQEGPSYPLKQFHNQIKRQLLERFAYGVHRLLDLACGRGGDIWKWIDAQILYVKGIDLSEGEIEEAQRRFSEAKKKRRGCPTEAEFEATANLGVSEWQEPMPFDAVTCMFAIHYFFVSEAALRQFLHNVSINLKEGGYFFGTMPDGKRVLAALKLKPVFEAPLLRLAARKLNPRQPECFGSSFSCAIGDTVTQGHGQSQGSYEYLVFKNVLVSVARDYGLVPVIDYEDAGLDALFEEADRGSFFKHFAPRFPESDPSLETASALNVAFVFRKE